MLAASATTALPAAPAAPETKSAATRAALRDKPPNQFCSAVPTICTSCSAVAVSMRRRILHPDQQAADGLLIRAEPPGKGRHALHELRDDKRRQQRQRTEKQRIADGHRPAAPAAKKLLRKKARWYVQYIGQQQPPAKRCQQPEKRPGPAQHARQPVCRGKHRRDARRQQQPVLHRVGCAVKTVFHCRSSCFVVHCLQRILCSSYLLLLYHFFPKGKEPYDWNFNNLRKADVFRENSRQCPPAGRVGAAGGRRPRRPAEGARPLPAKPLERGLQSFGQHRTIPA